MDYTVLTAIIFFAIQILNRTHERFYRIFFSIRVSGINQISATAA